MDVDEDSPPPPKPWYRHLGEWGGTLVLLAVVMQVIGAFRAPALPEQAPDFTLASLEGDPVELSSLHGQTVVLNFWATWCGPCRIEAPSFSSFSKANPDIRVLGIVADGPAAKVRRARTDLGMTYPVLLGDKDVLRAYGITTYPTTVVVGPEGDVRAAHTGLLFRPQLAILTRL